MLYQQDKEWDYVYGREEEIWRKKQQADRG